MKRLIAWARQQKRLGKLKQAFLVYTWCRQTERNILGWWRRNVTRVIYQGKVALRPNWENGHYFLGEELQIRYALLSSKDPIDARKITDISNRAIAHYRQVLEINPTRLKAYENLMSILAELGRMAEASIVLQQSEDVKRNLAEACQEDRLGIRLVPTRIATSVGFFANLDCYVKAGLLGWRQPHKIIMLLPDEVTVSNRCLLEYWGKYITVITDAETIQTLSPLAKHLEDPINYALTRNDQAFFMSAGYVMAHKQWDSEQRPPLLTLSNTDYERGWQCLEGLGVPKNSWFVCLHVREPGFKDRGSKFDSYRNANIDTYLLAIETIVAHGGWVIRMGDPSMKPLPAMDRVIDYVHTDARSDWMDVFLSSQCRFFIATSSGLGVIPVIFGVPMVQTNYLPWGIFWSKNQDLFLPRLLWSINEKRHLTFSEILLSPLSWGISQTFYNNAGVEMLHNTPDEINEIVLEMLMRLDGQLTYSVTDERLQERIRSLTEVCNSSLGAKHLALNCRIGKDFLRKYEALVEPEAELEIMKPG